MARDPDLAGLGDALLGSLLRRMEARITSRLDGLAHQIEQNAVDKEALEAALQTLSGADTTIDAIEPEGDAP